jgi:hypothetical protein
MLAKDAEEEKAKKKNEVDVPEKKEVVERIKFQEIEKEAQVIDDEDYEDVVDVDALSGLSNGIKEK